MDNYLKSNIVHKTIINKKPSEIFPLFSTSEGWDSWFTHGTVFLEGKDAYFNWHEWGVEKVSLKAKVEILEIIKDKRVSFNWNFGLSAGPTKTILELSESKDGTILSVTESGYENSEEGVEALMECSTGWGEALTLIKIFAEHGISYN